MEVRRDEETIAYFDSHAPEYSAERLQSAADFIRAHAGPGASLIDLGCGAGNTLDFMAKNASVEKIAGLDVSSTYVERVKERLGCDVYLGSILDETTIAAIDQRFDFAVVAAVLHHLIGRSRRESQGYAALAVANAKRLLNPGGHLIVHEPVFYPHLAMSGVFYVKKAMTRVTKRRIPVLGYWNNIGPPVVSYYTNEDLEQILRSGAPGEIVFRDIQQDRVPAAARPFIRRFNSTLAVKLS
jgi:SAM-dependent methyltransferase